MATPPRLHHILNEQCFVRGDHGSQSFLGPRLTDDTTAKAPSSAETFLIDRPTFPQSLSASSYLINKTAFLFCAVKCMKLNQQLTHTHDMYGSFWGVMIFVGICRIHSLLPPQSPFFSVLNHHRHRRLSSVTI